MQEMQEIETCKTTPNSAQAHEHLPWIAPKAISGVVTSMESCADDSGLCSIC